MNKRIQLHLEQDRLIKKIEELAKSLYREDSLVIVALTNYGFIRLSGYIEKVHAEIYTAYARNAGAPALEAFVLKSVSGLTNYKCQKCFDLAQKFSRRWLDKLTSHPEMGEGGRWKIALDGTYNVRNSQAHGGGQTADLSNLVQYFKSINEYFDFLEEVITN